MPLGGASRRAERGAREGVLYGGAAFGEGGYAEVGAVCEQAALRVPVVSQVTTMGEHFLRIQLLHAVLHIQFSDLWGLEAWLVLLN
jgi:hypothetical protein